jgi:hypothetical protein
VEPRRRRGGRGRGRRGGGLVVEGGDLEDLRGGEARGGGVGEVGGDGGKGLECGEACDGEPVAERGGGGGIGGGGAGRGRGGRGEDRWSGGVLCGGSCHGVFPCGGSWDGRSRAGRGWRVAPGAASETAGNIHAGRARGKWNSAHVAEIAHRGRDARPGGRAAAQGSGGGPHPGQRMAGGAWAGLLRGSWGDAGGPIGVEGPRARTPRRRSPTIAWGGTAGARP